MLSRATAPSTSSRGTAARTTTRSARVVIASRIAQASVAPAPRAPSFDYGIAPFDGARRRRRVIGLFVFFLVLVFGALFGTLIASWMEPR